MSESRPGPVTRWLNTTQPEALFVLSALAEYIGAAIAVMLFDEVEPQTVAWFRLIGATIALLAVSRGWWRDWSRDDLIAAGLFGIATALMNTFFYLAIDRVDLGKAVTIEFIGPIVVAAVATRSMRNAIALLFAVGGVAVLGGGEIDGNALGLLFILLASSMWAAYIVIGSKVAQLDRGVAGLGVGLAIGSIFITPIGAPWSGPVWVSPHPPGAVPARRRVLERDRLRHRPVRHAPHPRPAVLGAARAAARHGPGRRLDRPRPATLSAGAARRGARAGRCRRSGA